jgi:hypothetical protein
MAALSRKARLQAAELSVYFRLKHRERADQLLRNAILMARIRADDPHHPTRTFPSSYQDLEPLGFRWFKVHRYWFAVEETKDGNVIAALFHESTDIRRRSRD